MNLRSSGRMARSRVRRGPGYGKNRAGEPSGARGPGGGVAPRCERHQGGGAPGHGPRFGVNARPAAYARPAESRGGEGTAPRPHARTASRAARPVRRGGAPPPRLIQ